MYFWKIEELKESIKKDELSEKDRFIYVLIYIILYTLGLEAISLMPVETLNVWDYIISISNVLVVFVGTILAFRANGGNNGKDFLGRYFSIGFVVTIRFMVIFIPLYIALIFYYIYAFPEDEEIVSTIVDTALIIIWQAALYWRICKHIGAI